jgi:hypothetical protein
MINHQILRRVIRGLIVGGAVFFLACATPPPAPVVEVPQPVQEKDPFDLFSGTRLSGEGPYHVQAEPKAIESVRAVIEVLKIRTMTLEAPNGDTEEEISLRIRFKKGGKAKVRWLEVGESSRILGLAVKVLKGGDTYVEARKEYFPYALLEVK